VARLKNFYVQRGKVQKIRKETVPVSVSFISSREGSYTVHLEQWM